MKFTIYQQHIVTFLKKASKNRKTWFEYFDKRKIPEIILKMQIK